MICIFKGNEAITAESVAAAVKAVCPCESSDLVQDRKDGRYLLTKVADVVTVEAKAALTSYESPKSAVTLADLPDGMSLGNGITVNHTLPDGRLISWASFPTGTVLTAGQKASLRAIFEA